MLRPVPWRSSWFRIIDVVGAEMCRREKLSALCDWRLFLYIMFHWPFEVSNKINCWMATLRVGNIGEHSHNRTFWVGRCLKFYDMLVGAFFNPQSGWGTVAWYWKSCDLQPYVWVTIPTDFFVGWSKCTENPSNQFKPLLTELSLDFEICELFVETVLSKNNSMWQQPIFRSLLSRWVM